MKKGIIHILCYVLLLLCACQKKEVPFHEKVNEMQNTQEVAETTPEPTKIIYEYEYTNLSPRIEEKFAIYATSIKNAVTYQGEYAKYYFDQSLSAEQRDKFVKSSEQILEYIGKAMNVGEKIEIYAVDTMYAYNNESKKCTMDPKYVETSIQAALLIQAVLDSPTVNYGLLQAEGFCIAKRLGWDTSLIPSVMMANNEDFANPLIGKEYVLYEDTQDISFITEENKYLLDLEYPCFSYNYVGDQVEYAWNLSKNFSEFILNHEKEKEVFQLFESQNDLYYFEQEFMNLKNEWLESIGSDLQVEAKEYPVQYGNYGRFAPLQMKTVHGNWYIEPDFTTIIISDRSYSWIMKRDYQVTDQMMQMFEKELSEVDKILKNTEYEYPELEFHFNNSSSGEFAGLFQGKGKINIRLFNSVLHEYCHYLLLQEGLGLKNGIRLETHPIQLHLLAYYYGNFSEMNYFVMQLRYKQVKEMEDVTEEFRRAFQMFESKFDGEVKICDEEGMAHFMHYMAVLNDEYKYVSETAGTSLAIYIAENYGEEILYLVATGNDRVEELTGHTWDYYVGEWSLWLEENYKY